MGLFDFKMDQNKVDIFYPFVDTNCQKKLIYPLESSTAIPVS